MMGPFATAIATGCLDALRWLLWLVAGLLVALVAVQAIRGDDAAQPAQLSIMAAVAAAVGQACAFLSGKVFVAAGSPSAPDEK